VALLTIGAGAFAFVVAFTLAGLGFWTLLFAISGPAFTARPDWKGDALIGLYWMFLLAALNGLAFALATAASPHWRRRGPARVVLPSAVLGAVASVMSATGLWVLPTLALAWLGAAVAVGIGHASPGFLTGAIAHFWARRRAAAPPRAGGPAPPVPPAR
jgi:hypothetical protein